MDDEGDSSPESNPPPNDNGVVVLAQPAANPPHTLASNPPTVLVDVDNSEPQRDDENPVDALAT